MPRFTLDHTANKLVENVIWDGEPFVAWDDDARCISASWPSGDWMEGLRRAVDYAAVELADALVDDVDDVVYGWRRDSYLECRAELRHAEAVYGRLYRTGERWQFPGALVR